jgi:hypothetical protein
VTFSSYNSTILSIGLNAQCVFTAFNVDISWLVKVFEIILIACSSSKF